MDINPGFYQSDQQRERQRPESFWVVTWTDASHPNEPCGSATFIEHNDKMANACAVNLAEGGAKVRMYRARLEREWP